MILELEKGIPVITSGKFTASDSDHFQETSMTDSGSLTEPEYLVHFITNNGIYSYDDINENYYYNFDLSNSINFNNWCAAICNWSSL